MTLLPRVALLFLASASFALAAAAPADLVVFPAQLPDVPNGFNADFSPVRRWDQVPNHRIEGLTLTTADKSISKAPSAAMSYDMGSGGETLIIQVIDDAEVAAPLTRMGQDRLVSTQPLAAEGTVVSRVTIQPTAKAGVTIEGYLAKRKKSEPLLTLIVTDAKGTDRFVVMFSWLAANDNRYDLMVPWLLKAAALIDVAKLQSLP